MKYCRLLLFAVTLFLASGRGSNRAETLVAPPQDPPPAQNAYDMLDWMAMSFDLRSDSALKKPYRSDALHSPKNKFSCRPNIFGNKKSTARGYSFGGARPFVCMNS